MTTTQLIKLLQTVEFGASGRPREISLSVFDRKDEDFQLFFSEPEILINSTGDGIAGAELGLMFYKD